VNFLNFLNFRGTRNRRKIAVDEGSSLMSTLTRMQALIANRTPTPALTPLPAIHFAGTRPVEDRSGGIWRREGVMASDRAWRSTVTQRRVSGVGLKVLKVLNF
jgi:hypothetical protein